ncbi:hypothetical protein [Rhodohalobacter sp. 8-1]|uniref:hypothetical protein n=1 Tax=Rhodohalobacter sp. 8-1 TaxID=3131972 RepID=UPI0030EF162A
METSESVKSGRILIAIALGFLGFTSAFLFFPRLDAAALFAGYGVGFLAIGLHYLISVLSLRWENETFLALYTPLSLLRLITVLGIFIALIFLGKFDQFSFTVSFLISYIYHSVINIFLLNKRTNNRPG